MTPNLTELQRLAQEATQGEWEFEDTAGNQFIHAIVKKGKRRSEDKIKTICALPGITARDADFRYIAACSPSTILALVAEGEKVEALEKEVAELRKDKARLDWLERHGQWHDPENRFKVIFPVETLPFINVREALDAAISATKGASHE